MAEVFSFQDRRKLIEDKKVAEATLQEQVAEEAASELHRVNIAGLLEILDSVRKLVEQGRVDGLILLAHDPLSGLFNTQISMREGVVPRRDYATYLGGLTALQMELMDMVQMAPCVNEEGLIVDPYEEDGPAMLLDDNGEPIE